MKNSMLLRVATGLCVANVFLALWSSWSLSSVRSRLAVAEGSLRDAARDMESMQASLASESASRESGVKELGAELKAVSQVLDRLVRPQPPTK